MPLPLRREDREAGYDWNLRPLQPTEGMLTEGDRRQAVRHLRRLLESSGGKAEGKGQGKAKTAERSVFAAADYGAGTAAQNDPAPRKAAKDLG